MPCEILKFMWNMFLLQNVNSRESYIYVQFYLLLTKLQLIDVFANIFRWIDAHYIFCLLKKSKWIDWIDCDIVIDNSNRLKPKYFVFDWIFILAHYCSTYFLNIRVDSFNFVTLYSTIQLDSKIQDCVVIN